MLAITLYDLRFRARQFAIAVAGASLVFAMTLLLSGLVAGFGYEIDQTASSMRADTWAVAQSSSGRMAALAPVPAAATVEVGRSPGVLRASPIAIVPQAAEIKGAVESIVLVGAPPGDLGQPHATVGRDVRGKGEAVVDTRTGLGVGQTFSVTGHAFRVVGTVTGKTMLGGVPDVYVPLADAQAIAFGGRPLVSAILVRGRPQQLPAGLALRSISQIEAASLSQLASVRSSIVNLRSFMWVIAAVIVAALVYVSALERTRDFAVLKALGSSSRALFLGLAAQAVLVALLAAAIAAALSHFMTGLFSQPVRIPPSAYSVLPIAAVAVGLLSSLVALRRAISVDPAAAFAGA